MASAVRLFLCICLSSLPVSGVEADVVLEVDERTVMVQTAVGKETVETTESTVFVGPERARVDRGEQTMILREDLAILWIIDHPSRTYQEIDLPVELEAYVPEESRSAAAQLLALLTANTEVERSGEMEQVGPWNVQRWQAHVIFPLAGSADEYDFWLTADLDYDMGAYEALLRAVNGLDPKTRSWYGKIVDLDGIVVRSEARKGLGQSLRVTATSELETVTEKEVPEAFYEVPGGYRQVPFRFEARLKGP